ncbi:hypothetical protein WOLCODRAFT_21009 [Wolfiporia cocos MD-104 SS10]|uniref:Uncharacterized protein n=1 Tax=Wolfiporia cocos (strain MD-104) TaxID=742152 RepID=A0A2H3JMP0_WOLCO|nr:hypothetical protein WOLCODRAFT_21009 [Wolfiporia cocos MD-104 SS10]
MLKCISILCIYHLPVSNESLHGDSDLHEDDLLVHSPPAAYQEQNSNADINGEHQEYEDEGNKEAYKDEFQGKDENADRNQDINEETESSEPDPASLVPHAFLKSSAVRLAYFESVLDNVFNNITVKASEQTLRCVSAIIEECGLLSELTLPRPARSLVTAKPHLGLSVDDYFEKIPICTVCFKSYTQDEINALASPQCTAQRCKGVVWKIKRTASRLEKCYPTNVQPYASLIKALRRFLK